MATDCAITAAMKRAQETMFRKAAERGLSQKVIAADTGLSLTIIGQYARGETAMGGPSIIKMFGVIPDDLLSLLLPDGRIIVRAPHGIDHDALCDWAEGYVATKTKAHRADSPMGPEIADCERTELDSKVAAFPVSIAA